MAEYLCLEEDVVVGGELVCTNRTDRNPNVSWGNHTNLSVVFGEELDIVLFVRLFSRIICLLRFQEKYLLAKSTTPHNR